MAPAMQREIGTRMVTIGTITALVLFAPDAFLMTLLHISGGIVRVLLALKMTARPDESPVDPKQLVMYPLAVPCFLNPVSMTVLIIASNSSDGFWAKVAGRRPDFAASLCRWSVSTI